jgi:hypothetical protein
MSRLPIHHEFGPGSMTTNASGSAFQQLTVYWALGTINICLLSVESPEHSGKEAGGVLL